MVLINELSKKWQQFLVVFLSLFLMQLPDLHEAAKFFAEYLGLVVLWFAVVSVELNRKPFSLHWAYSVLVFCFSTVGSLVANLMLKRFGLFSSPFFASIVLLGLLTDRRMAIGMALFSSAVMIVSVEPSSLDIGLILTSNIVAAVTSSGLRKRLHVVKPALFTVLCNVLFLLLNSLSRGRVVLDRTLLVSLLMPFLFSVVDLGLLPFVEYASLVYSDIDLVELGNINHPLIKLLSLRAPGTYYHSTIVANLAEAAAERIGANPVLARTAAYFHDVGKVRRPYFYTENIQEKNPHDELNPKLSHLIVLDHVKYGQELARRHRLPLLVQDVIPQHHGTRVQKYFYYKAKEMGANLSEDEFRYPGPKPQFKEAGIIMLADSVEAAFRSVKNPTLSRIKSLVEEIVSGIYNERELDESGLTLKDLEAVANEFTRVLFNMFKSRIEYPKEEIKRVITLAESSDSESNETQDSNQKDSENS